MKKKLCALFLALALVLCISAPASAETPMFYVEYEGVTYELNWSYASGTVNALYTALCNGTATNPDGGTVSIPGLAERGSDTLKFYNKENFAQSQAVNETSTLSVSEGGTLLLLEPIASVSLAVSGSESTVTVSSLYGGGDLTEEATVADLKDTMLLIGQTNGPAVSGSDVSAPRTLGGVAISWNGNELADDVTYAEILDMAEAASTDLETTPLTVTLPFMDGSYTYVEISWSSMTVEFEYDPGVWDTENHRWNDHWSVPDGNDPRLVIKNYSVGPIDYQVQFSATAEGVHVNCDATSDGSPMTGTLEGAESKVTSEIPTAELALNFTVISAPTDGLYMGDWTTVELGLLTVTLGEETA